MGQGVPIKGRQVRSDKKHRVQTYLTKDLHDKINRLARACGTSESKISEAALNYLLNSPEFVNWIQDKHGLSKEDPFRLRPVIDNGKVIY